LNEAPRIVVTTYGQSVEEILDNAREAKSYGADVVEIRFDLSAAFDITQLMTLRESLPLPAIVTLRSRREGGQCELPKRARTSRLHELIGAGFSYADIELSLGEEAVSGMLDSCAASGSHPILSKHFHDPPGSSGDVLVIADRCESCGSILKTAHPLAAPGQIDILYESAILLKDMGLQYAIMGTGPAGEITRYLAPAMGCMFVFTHMPGRTAIVEGQVSVQRLRSVWSEVPGLFRLGNPKLVELYALFGSQIAQSLSPAIHNAVFTAARRRAVYIPMELSSDSKASLVNLLAIAGLKGANLTMPFKEIVPQLDSVDKVAGDIGAVNTVVRTDAGYKGFNTDSPGFLWALQDAGFTPKGKKALIIGAGGASRAAVHSLSRADCVVWLWNRTESRARNIADLYPGKVWAAGTDDVPAILSSADLLVNATPLTAPESFPFPISTLHEGQHVFDFVTRLVDTPLIKAARAVGAVAIPGLELLTRQAALSQQIWTGERPTLELLARATRSVVRGV